MDARVLPLSRISLPQALAGAVGIGGISLGVVGLVHGGNGDHFFGVTDERLLGLALNPAHDVQHLLVGAAGLAVMFSLRASRAFGRAIYFFFMLQVLAGIVTFFVPAWNLLGLNEADLLMHALGAVTGLAIAWGAEHRANSTARPGGAMVTGGSGPSGSHQAGGATGDVRVLVVDDDPLVREALAEMLAGEDDLTVVGACEDGWQVGETVGHLHPDVVCMDWSMPMLDGLAAAQALRAAAEEVRIIVLTGGSATRHEAAAVGADALVPKSASPDALLHCLRTVAVGGTGCPYCL